jgi:hypothetical protein
MLDYGWSPGVAGSWDKAPAGDYVIYARLSDGATSLAAGSVVSVVVGSREVRTRVDWTPDGRWFPVGVLNLGARRDGTIGSISAVVKIDGTTAGTGSVRIFRDAPDTALVHANNLGVKTLIIDVPDLDRPAGGVWSTNTTDADAVAFTPDAWGIPIMVPTVTALYVDASGATPTTTLTYRPRHNTYPYL